MTRFAGSRIGGKRHRIDARNAAPFLASNRLLERRLREHWTTPIGRRDSLIRGLLAHEWRIGELLEVVPANDPRR